MQDEKRGEKRSGDKSHGFLFHDVTAAHAAIKRDRGEEKAARAAETTSMRG